MGRRLVGRTADHFPAAIHGIGETDHELLAQLVDGLPVGLIYFDSAEAGIKANRLARKLLGRPSTDVAPRIDAERLERLGIQLEPDEKAMEGPKAYDDIRVGNHIYAVTSFPVEGIHDGGIVWRIEDVTERRAVEAKLREAKRALLLCQASGAVGHEFNNLLSRVICLAEEIQEEPDAREVHKYAERLILTAEQGAGVVRRLMTYASGSAVDVQAVDLSQTLDLWRAGAFTDGLVLDVESCTATVLIDPVLLRASLDELLSNARQAGATRIAVVCTQDPIDLTTVVEVVDDGAGMNAPTAARAAEPFFTTHPAGARAGLGLSVVKGALDQWGGGLELISQLGKGTTVKMRLPPPRATPGADI